MNPDTIWPYGRYTLGSLAAFAARLRVYGKDRVPRTGGLVMAFNHLSWIDVPLFGFANPRNTYFVAKVEAHKVAGLGQFIRLFGTVSIRRGESDREAVRQMRELARAGKAVGVFVEGTRQRSGVPGIAQPGATLVAQRENVPVVCGAVHGTQTWKLGNFHPCTIAFSEPMSLEGLGRDEATQAIEAKLRTLWEWLVDLHERGRRPRRATPPA
jgi:1-acyl-sn-glycerol-3-phosphate acyltransferase